MISAARFRPWHFFYTDIHHLSHKLRESNVFGRFDEMVLVFMIERRWGRDLLPYMSPTGGGYSKEFDRSNPAWDYR